MIENIDFRCVRKRIRLKIAIISTDNVSQGSKLILFSHAAAAWGVRGGTPRHARTQRTRTHVHAHAHKATHTRTQTWSGSMAHAAAQACMYTLVVVAAAVVVMVVV